MPGFKFRPLRCALAAAALALAAGGAAYAHHSFSMFDMVKEIEIKGTVIEFQWTNPHSWIEVAVKNPQGAVEQWGIELGPPTVLSRIGWSRRLLKPGDSVTIGVHPLRNGASGGALSYIILSDGKRLDQRPPLPPGAPAPSAPPPATDP